MVFEIMFFSEAAGMLVTPVCGKLGHLREVGAGHADHLGVGAAGANLHPVVLHQLDGDVAVGQQLDVVVKFARGNGAGAGLFDLGGAGSADALVQIGSGDGDAVVFCLDEKVRQDGDCCLALDDALRCCQLAQQILAADAYFQRRAVRVCSLP